MIKRFPISLLYLILALPVYAGQGTINETDTEIVIEFNGADDIKQDAKTLKTEQDRESVKQEMAPDLATTPGDKNSKNAEHRKDEE